MLARRLMLVAVAQLLAASLLSIGIWVALPARFALVDIVGTALAVLLFASAASLLARRPWALRLALYASWATLGVGAATCSALAFAAAHLSGLYGPLGAGGALLLGTVAALVLPYLVGLPALQLACLARPAPGAR